MFKGEGVCVPQAGVAVPGDFVVTFTIHRIETLYMYQ
jgi:hypothetical protein